MRAYLLLLLLFMAIIFIASGRFLTKNDTYEISHKEVVLRHIGHQVLLSAGDASSRVLPVRKVDEDTYQLAFQSKVSFISDSLINIVQRTLQNKTSDVAFMVRVKECAQKATVFAFELNSTGSNLTPCLGRQLDYGCYLIEIQFLQAEKFNWAWLLLMLPVVIGSSYFIASRQSKKDPAKAPSAPSDSLLAGKFSLYPSNNLLKIANEAISLTEKETKALEIFFTHINEVIERERLMKELWENEGTVVISRNVDVMVSKLRRKLLADETLKIITIAGRGYKLVID
ncbi:MAG: winged helix family transcriptional regulator [Bacteroidetes bacterium]|nr:MAG: winged helix family transcriptional regulator [Bacteroidota bacterium]